MRKYLYIYKMTLMENLQYTLNILFSFITFILVIFVYRNLWEYVYSDSQNLIAGYTMKQMIWYVTLTEIMWFGNGNGALTVQISQDIRSGAIAYGMNKPYHYIYYCIAKHFGDVTIKIGLYMTAGTLIGIVFAGTLDTFKVRYLPVMLVATVAGLVINALLRMTISITSFWIEDAKPFHWIYSKFIILIGITFPIEMFPAWAQPLIRYSPIYVTMYGPVKLIIDFNWSTFFSVMIAQCIYLAATLAIMMALYQKGVKRLNVNGG